MTKPNVCASVRIATRIESTPHGSFPFCGHGRRRVSATSEASSPAHAPTVRTRRWVDAHDGVWGGLPVLWQSVRETGQTRKTRRRTDRIRRPTLPSSICRGSRAASGRKVFSSWHLPEAQALVSGQRPVMNDEHRAVIVENVNDLQRPSTLRKSPPRPFVRAGTMGIRPLCVANNKLNFVPVKAVLVDLVEVPCYPPEVEPHCRSIYRKSPPVQCYRGSGGGR